MNKDFNLHIIRSVFVALFILFSNNVGAYNVGVINVKRGVQTRVDLPSEWKNELQKASVVVTNAPWSSSNSKLRIRSNQRYYCDIYTDGFSGEVTLDYYIDFVDRNWTTKTLSLTWTVIVDDTSPNSNPDNEYEEDKIEEPIDSWDKSGNYSISWYKKNETEFTISTNKELAGMAYLVNNGYTDFKDCTLRLANDIDLSDKKWVACSTFKGTFDGQEHTISGIFIGTDAEDQLKFGFWQHLNGATIINLNLEGTTFFYAKKKSAYDVYAGGLVGQADNSSEIKNCKVNMNINFKRGPVSSVSSLRPMEYYSEASEHCHVGGIIGYLKSGNIQNCVNLGSIKCYFRESMIPQGLSVSGIVGYCYYDGIIEYCENLSPLIKVVDGKYAGSAYFLRFINGICHSQNFFGKDIKCCRSVIDEIDVDIELDYDSDTPSIHISGISPEGKSLNCYSAISTIRVNTNISYTKMYYGGIKSETYGSSPQSCFSNSDVDISFNVRGKKKTYEKGRDGSTTFSAEQMKTHTFLDELNMYSTLELDGPVWKFKDGEYPYINEVNKGIDTEINKVTIQKDKSNMSIYDLYGRKWLQPQKGLNILDGKKVVIK